MSFFVSEPVFAGTPNTTSQTPPQFGAGEFQCCDGPGCTCGGPTTGPTQPTVDVSPIQPDDDPDIQGIVKINDMGPQEGDALSMDEVIQLKNILASFNQQGADSAGRAGSTFFFAPGSEGGPATVQIGGVAQEIDPQDEIGARSGVLASLGFGAEVGTKGMIVLVLILAIVGLSIWFVLRS